MLKRVGLSYITTLIAKPKDAIYSTDKVIVSTPIAIEAGARNNAMKNKSRYQKKF